MMKKLLIFGTGSGYRNIKDLLDSKRVAIIAFIDNDHRKIGKELDGKRIISPEDIYSYQFNNILIASQYYEEMARQLEKLGINKESIVSVFDIMSLLKSKHLFHEEKLREYLIKLGVTDDFPLLLMQRILEKNDRLETWNLLDNYETLFSGDPRIHLLKAYMALKEHKFERAEEFIREGIENSIVDLRAESSLTDYCLANYYEQKQDYYKAILLYEKVFFQTKGEQSKEIIKRRLQRISNKFDTAMVKEETIKSKALFASGFMGKGTKVITSRTLPVYSRTKIIRQGSCKDFEFDLIKLNWQLTHACNYKCSYCFNRGTKIERINEDIIPNALNNAFVNISRLSGYKIKITLTGGEPTIHPDYLKILSWLNENIKNSKVITITNLSRDVDFYREVVGTVKEKDRVLYVASYHFEQAEMNSFVRNAWILCENNVKISISILALPEYMRQVKELFSKLSEVENENLVIKLKLIRRGNLIDERYTESDLLWINHILRKQNKKDIFIDIITDDTIERFYCNGNELIEREMNRFKGFLCYAGVKMAAIDPQGNISPAVCFRGKKLPYEQKNIFREGTDILSTHPVICPFDYCSCLSDLELPKYHPSIF